MSILMTIFGKCHNKSTCKLNLFTPESIRPKLKLLILWQQSMYRHRQQITYTSKADSDTPQQQSQHKNYVYFVVCKPQNKFPSRMIQIAHIRRHVIDAVQFTQISSQITSKYLQSKSEIGDFSSRIFPTFFRQELSLRTRNL